MGKMYTLRKWTLDLVFTDCMNNKTGTVKSLLAQIIRADSWSKIKMTATGCTTYSTRIAGQAII